MNLSTRRKWKQRPLRLVSAGLLAFACLLVQTTAMAQSDLTGYWVLDVPNGDGTVRKTYFELHQNGEAISGTMMGRGPKGTPVSGTIKEGAVQLQSLPPAAPAAGRPLSAQWPIVYTGTYRDGKLSLQIRNHRGDISEGTGERTTREATLPPPKLPLPALRDLPDNGLVRTPPMGWNSWNKFAGRIDDPTVRSMADAMVSTGMSKLGYVYINIDDTWEGGRDAAGNITPNRKFPDMKALAGYVHSKGLKLGIYSSPGPTTCAGYEGSFGHEVQDAQTYAAWGFDYLKFDLCSARNIYQPTPEDHQGLYQKMGEALQETHRPIVYSLCQYGEADVWKWGAKTGANLWRTTGDIRDEWESMDRIGFNEIDIAPFARPGHWNDPDMLEIGNGGMNREEYRSHMSLWSLLSAPLIAGNDLRSMTEETKSILMNAEVIAIDQDRAAKPARRLKQEGNIEILERPLEDGSIAVGIFNRGDADDDGSFSWDSLMMGPGRKNLRVRDLWKHQAVSADGEGYTAHVPSHGVVLLRISDAGKS
jgi:alpha-galactosidase